MKTFRVVTDRGDYTVTADDFNVQAYNGETTATFYTRKRVPQHVDDLDEFNNARTLVRHDNVACFSNIVSVQIIPDFEDEDVEV